MTISAQDFISATGATNIYPAGAMATGLLAPIMRAAGHLTFALAGSTSNPPLVTPEEMKDEVNEAARHLIAAFTYEEDCLSAYAKGNVNFIKQATIDLTENWDTWDAQERPRCLLSLINAYASTLTLLDRELAGIPNDRAVPGSAL